MDSFCPVPLKIRELLSIELLQYTDQEFPGKSNTGLFLILIRAVKRLSCVWEVSVKEAFTSVWATFHHHPVLVLNLTAGRRHRLVLSRSGPEKLQLRVERVQTLCLLIHLLQEREEHLNPSDTVNDILKEEYFKGNIDITQCIG